MSWPRCKTAGSSTSTARPYRLPPVAAPSCSRPPMRSAISTSTAWRAAATIIGCTSRTTTLAARSGVAGCSILCISARSSCARLVAGQRPANACVGRVRGCRNEAGHRCLESGSAPPHLILAGQHEVPFHTPEGTRQAGSCGLVGIIHFDEVGDQRVLHTKHRVLGQKRTVNSSQQPVDIHVNAQLRNLFAAPAKHGGGSCD